MTDDRSASAQIRSPQDVGLHAQLLGHADVKRVNEAIERQEQEGAMGTRRRLLATSVRLSKQMAPELHRMASVCGDRLGLNIPLELYVFSSPQFNAACVKPEEGRLFVMFSSSILEGFSEAELQFVMGHELGHYIYGHHDIPFGYLMRGAARPVSPRLALDLSSWSRFAEVSADRAGAHCSEGLEPVARSLFKLASGLTGDFVHFDLDAFLRQVDEMQFEADDPTASAPAEDWFLTHPFSPIRVKALKLFFESELMSGEVSSADLELGVQGIMSLMEPSYLEGRTSNAESMRRLLLAAAVALVHASGTVDDRERNVFEQFFGANSLSDKLNIERTIATLEDRATTVLENTTRAQRMQVIRDLCVLARADGRVDPTECAVLRDIAAKLDIGRFFVDRTLDDLAAAELD